MGVIESLRGSAVTFGATKAPEVHSAECLNCGTPLGGPFCSNCGQRDIPPYPSVRELAVDAFWELSGWDGRFAATVKALVRRPGMLTLEFLQGRRARYLSPLRLYLLASLVYFVLAAAAPRVTLASGKTPLYVGLRPTPSTTTAGAHVSGPARVSSAMTESIKDPGSLSAATKDSVLKIITRAPAVMRPFMRRLVLDPVGFKRGLVETMPRMLFALLPVYAAIVAMFFRGRKYPEHLYFAIHVHAFMFVALAAPKLVAFTGIPPITILVGLLALMSIPVYTTLAFRRVYGQSMTRTLTKEVAIGAIYLVAAFVAFMLTLYWVSVYG